MKLLCNSFVAFYIFASLFSEGKINPTCQIYHENGTLLSDYEWKDGLTFDRIDDITPVGTILKTFTTDRIRYIMTHEVNGIHYYLTVTKPDDKNEFYIEIRFNFDQYEDNETSETMLLKTIFVCDDNESKTLYVKIPLKDTNNHFPQFTKSKYEYKLAMPLPKGFDFDTLDQIVVRDIDLTNKAIDFAIKGDEKYTKGFLITSLGPNKEDKKNHTARFITSMAMDFEEDTTFTLSATDSGEPSRTTETNLTILVDKENSFPRFSEPEYIADLTDLDYKKVNKVLLKYSNGKNISLDRGYGGSLDFSLSGLSEENKKHFELSRNGSNVYIELSDLEDTFLSQGIISLILTATKETTQASSAIVILLPEVIDTTVTEESTTTEPQESITENHSLNVYMISTIILALTSLALLGYTIYLHLYKIVIY